MVLLSGGMDSAATLGIACAEGYLCHALSVDYGQRHVHEVQCAAAIARHLGAVEHKVVRSDLRVFGGSALTADIAVPKGRSEAELASQIPVTYVPARNLIFLSLALAYAETVGAFELFIGINSVDYSGYPDCRREFIDQFERTATLATKAGVERRASGSTRPLFRVRTPLVSLTKAEIIRRGIGLGVDFSLTTSCYDPVKRGEKWLACGSCDSCQIRARGFLQAGIADPTAYAAAPARSFSTPSRVGREGVRA